VVTAAKYNMKKLHAVESLIIWYRHATFCLASHISELMDTAVGSNYQLSPLDTPWDANGTGINLSSELLSVLLWTSPFVIWETQWATLLVRSLAEWNWSLFRHISSFRVCFTRVFLSCSDSLPSISSILSSSKCCLLNIYIQMSCP
jgi:hypothetical protein